jgi:L-aminopeptidase/D-esterase-like protein
MSPRAARAGTLTGVDGVRVGHAEEVGGTTGVTAILFDRAAPTVVDVRGGASCTYDTASLSLDATFGRRWAIFFAGGSVHGLDAARGIRAFVLSQGGGHRTFANPNPIAPISGATLFDLPRKLGPISDYLPLGFEAARTAGRDPVRTGRVGAGAGATVGKYRGRGQAMHGGVGSSLRRVAPGRHLGAIAIVNSVGAVRDPSTGAWIAGARGRGHRIQPPSATLTFSTQGATGRGTTLIALATDVGLPRATLQRVAVAAHAGLAQVVVPVHTALDGDVVFVSSTGEGRELEGEPHPGAWADRLGQLAGEVVIEAVLQAAHLGNPPSGASR